MVTAFFSPDLEEQVRFYALMFVALAFGQVLVRTLVEAVRCHPPECTHAIIIILQHSIKKSAVQFAIGVSNLP